MDYVLVISATAEAVLDEILDRYPIPGLLEAFDALCLELARHPVTVMKKSTPYFAGYPTVTGVYENFVFVVVFRFLEDERRLEMLDVGLIEL